MLFTWNERTIRWFLDASAYTGFHNKLAQKIMPYLSTDYSLCDLGCGLGRLDLEIAPFVKNLTAVDINELVIRELQRDAAGLGLKNLNACRGDVMDLNARFDVVLTSFFGQLDTNIQALYNLCARKFIRIVSAENKGNLYPEQHRKISKATIATVKNELDKNGLRFKLETATLEFGQPLRSWEDAAQFILLNAPKAGEDEINNFLYKNIVHTGSDDFPIYLPNPKELGIFIIYMEE